MTRLAKRMCSAVLAAGLVCGCILPASAAEAEEARILQYETAEPVSAVTANVENAELVIQAVQTDKITVESAADGKGKFTYNFSVKDDVLTVDVDAIEPEEFYGRETDSSGSVFIKSGRIYDNTITVTLPEKTYTSLCAEVDNGGIRFADVEADALQAKVKNGSVAVQNVKADTVQTKIENGNALAKDVTAGTLRTEAGNGRIEFWNVTAGSLQADLKTGSIGFEKANASAYKCDVKTGSIQGTLQGNQAAYRISVDLDWNWGVSSLKNQPGDGSGKSIDFHVQLGNVDVSFTA